MKPNHIITLSVLVMMLAGCSQSNIVIKAKSSMENEQDGSTLPTEIRKVTNDYNLSFPISENPNILGLHHKATMIGQLYIAIGHYRRATGSYPDSLHAYLGSGFPLFWQRNLMNGLPMKILSSGDVKNNPDNFGLVKWEKMDNDHGRLISSNIDTGKYKDTGYLSWESEIDELVYINQSEYESMSGDELHDFYKEQNRADLENFVTIVGGTIPINKLTDPESRFVYAQCGQLSDFIFSTMTNYYTVHKTLPNDFTELLAFQQELGGTPFVIRENLDQFAQKLKNVNAELKIGIDRSAMLSFAFLKIDDEVLISHCYKYDNNPENPDYYSLSEDDSPGIHVGCYMDKIDMSSPMISSENISNLDIPIEFTILIADIPIV